MGEPGIRPRSRTLKVSGTGTKGGLERTEWRVEAGIGVKTSVWERVRRSCAEWGDMVSVFGVMFFQGELAGVRQVREWVGVTS
jgi:hypothetical protein